MTRWIISAYLFVSVAALLAIPASERGWLGIAPDPLSAIPAMLLGLPLILPNFAVGVRRLHDIGRSGWWILIGRIPIIGTLILVYRYVQPSEPGENQYG